WRVRGAGFSARWPSSAASTRDENYPLGHKGVVAQRRTGDRPVRWEHLLRGGAGAQPSAARARCRHRDPTPRRDGRSRRHPDPHPTDPSAHGSHPGPWVFRPSLSRRSGGARLWPFFFSSRRPHTISKRDWSSDVCSSDLSVKDRPSMRTMTSPSCMPAAAAGELGSTCAQRTLPLNVGSPVAKISVYTASASRKFIVTPATDRKSVV